MKWDGENMQRYMKEMKNKLIKNDIDVFLLILTLVSGACFLVFVNCYDELWNFANCYKMFNGYKIYEDLNVIITPLFYYIAQMFFKVFEANLLAFRIYNVCISATFFMLIYKIFKTLKVVKERSTIYTVIIIFIFRTMISSGANYNIFALIPILIAILLILNKKESSISVGILLTLTFLLKQNIYVYFALGIFIYKLITLKSIKRLICDLLKIYIISLIGIAIFLLYMFLDNNLDNFINYCFGGIGEFGTKNFYLDLLDARFIYVSIISIFLTLFITYNKKARENVNNEIIYNAKILLSFGTPLLLISFPLVNYYHATLGSAIMIIEFIYIIENILIKNFEIKKEKSIYYIIIIIYIIYIMYGIVINVLEIKKGKVVILNDGAFYGTLMQKEDYENMNIICKYIQEQEKQNVDVKILSYKANLYMVNLNKNNGIFDLAFVGNLGNGGEENLIEQLKKEDSIILIQTNDQKIFWQESKKAREYIISNYEKKGEIEEYSIYHKK